MVTKVKTFTFVGTETIDICVEVKLSAGIVAFNIVGLPDKAVNEAKERIRAAINSIGLSFPARRLTINLSPANLNKEGSYLDLPMALGLLAEMNVIKQETVDNYVVVGELSLDGAINAVGGILPIAMGAIEKNMGIICPKSCAREALWADENINIIAVDNILTLINHLNGKCQIEKPILNKTIKNDEYLDLKDVYGQIQGKRALEIAAAGGHNLLMIGPPGTGKSMLAQRILGILPELTAREILEINVINSIAGKLLNGELIGKRPFLDPHHSCSMPAMVGGGSKPKPGQISLAHNGILFLDELPEFPRQVLDSLRQPLETGKISVARALQNITYPAEFQLIAAMNPCRCGHYGDVTKQCKRAPACAQEYQNKISGPILDRFDLFVDIPKIDIFKEKINFLKNETSATVKARVESARKIQAERYKDSGSKKLINAYASNNDIEKHMFLDDKCEDILKTASQMFGLSLRSYNKIIKVSRTIADLCRSAEIKENHVAEALMFKQTEFLVNR
ncbi:MAG: YifB family Mg chelatase-like AAA ATPase [Rickettsiales bacterium]|jgi:magnesium chelatase family protein|nr:YifB family Mg chelatase-like AAA ATPase [Rickettsiales bacterium]